MIYMIIILFGCFMFPHYVFQMTVNVADTPTMYRQLQVILLMISIVWQNSDAIRCRVCNSASTTDDCSRSVDCAANELCYIDELVTAQLTIIYNSGCRPIDVCGGAHIIGKRSSGDLIACSRCCNKTITNGLECNMRICGIKSMAVGQQCIYCDGSKPGGNDVDSSSLCNTQTNCKTHEICGTEMFSRASHRTHRYTCLNSTDCILRTQLALQDLDRCRDPHKLAAGMCGKTKRNSHLCTACCGDALCNYGTCFELLDRLYNLWKRGGLDFNTLMATPYANATPSSHSG